MDSVELIEKLELLSVGANLEKILMSPSVHVSFVDTIDISNYLGITKEEFVVIMKKYNRSINKGFDSYLHCYDRREFKRIATYLRKCWGVN